jgi:hypothetical protein
MRSNRAHQRFQRIFWAVVATLSIVSAVFLLLGSLQGPKLSSAIVDPARVTEQAGQQLRLFANQPLAEVTPEQVTVTPAAEVSVTVQNELLIVQFEQRLLSATEYTVEVRDVPATSRDATATFAHSFTTSAAELLYIDRGDDIDEVLRTSASGTGRGELVYAAVGIQRIAAVENVIVVARDAPRGTSVLDVVSRDGAVQQVPLPEGVRVERLIAPPVGTLLGMVLSTATPPLDGDGDDAGQTAELLQTVQPGQPGQQALLASVLAVVDLAADGIVTIVQGLDGLPITTLNAQFLPDGATMILHDFDQNVLRVELVGAPLVLPIGQMAEAYALSSDGTRLTGSDSFGGVILNLATGVETRLNPSLVDGELAFGGESILTATQLRVQKVAVVDPATSESKVLLVADEGTGAARVLLRTIDDRGSLGVISLAPNDQFVAVEVTPSVVDAQPDGRPVNGRPTSVTTIIVDVMSGAVVRTLNGFSPVW